MALVMVALLGCGYVMEHWVERVVSASFDEKIDLQALTLGKAVDSDGRLHEDRVMYLPDLEFRGQGWGWTVRTQAGEWHGGVRFGRVQMLPMDPDYARDLESADAVAQNGAAMRVRILRSQQGSGTVEVMVAAPRSLLDEVEAKGLRSIIIVLAMLSAGLGAAAIMQLHYGLRPLREFQLAIARVRAGEVANLPEDSPRELQPLATELQALLRQNEEGLAHARRHVANLAHGLKTPLATLALRLGRDGASAESRELVAQLDQRIAHHLRRARSAAAGVGTRVRADLSSVAGDLVFAMGHVHDGRGLSIRHAVPAPCVVGVDREDLDEVIGNLLDNACKWAHTQVTLTAQINARNILVRVCDDGPGITPEGIPEAMRAGARLDESRAGFGFGLTIATELAQLYGGSLELGRCAELGGLEARLSLPKALGAVRAEQEA